jgi:ribonuclease T2
MIPQAFRLFVSLASAIFLFCLEATPSFAQANGGAFDFYVFTLSWSPGFCDTGGETKSPEQCSQGAARGFVVHGLWPDNRYSIDPEDCGEQAVSAAALQLSIGVYPNTGLARYEYKKHGTCTGLSPEAYFSAVKSLWAQIVVPELLKAPQSAVRTDPQSVVKAFIASNVNLGQDSVAVTCSRGELIDVRICVSKDLRAYAVCPSKVLGHTCRSAQLIVAPLR